MCMRRAPLAVAVALALSTGVEAQTEMSADRPIEPEVAAFLSKRFESVSAFPIAANVSAAICREQKLEPPGVSALGCDIDFGCGTLVTVLVLRYPGAMAIGLGDVESWVAVYCPQAIADPEKRAEVIRIAEERLGVELE
jgi:hypothetical protein